MSDESYLTPEELVQLKNVFYVQAKDMLAEFNDRALELEVSSEPSEVFRALARVVHTVKCSWQRLAAHPSRDCDLGWLVEGPAAKYGIEPMRA